MQEPPYRRITAELRGRILGGELRPGDRVPSTRAITQRWGVAMATATKVIAALRDEGLVETRPGTGTLVRGTGLDGRQAVPELTRERVLRAAIELADASGLAALSMRQVATELGVPTMSLYRHVPGKHELTLLMTDAAFGEFPFPANRPDRWRPCMEQASRLMWTVFKRHPWAAEMLSLTRPQALANLVLYTEWTLAPLQELGLDNSTCMSMMLTLYGHVRSCGLNLLAESHARQDTGMTADEWADTETSDLFAIVNTGRYPALQQVVQAEFDYDLDALFEFGLRSLLDGFAVLLRRASR